MLVRLDKDRMDGFFACTSHLVLRPMVWTLKISQGLTWRKNAVGCSPNDRIAHWLLALGVLVYLCDGDLGNSCVICPEEEHGINRPHGCGGGGGKWMGLLLLSKSAWFSSCELVIISSSSSSSPICVQSACCVKISFVICVCDGFKKERRKVSISCNRQQQTLHQKRWETDLLLRWIELIMIVIMISSNWFAVVVVMMGLVVRHPMYVRPFQIYQKWLLLLLLLFSISMVRSCCCCCCCCCYHLTCTWYSDCGERSGNTYIEEATMQHATTISKLLPLTYKPASLLWGEHAGVISALVVLITPYLLKGYRKREIVNPTSKQASHSQHGTAPSSAFTASLPCKDAIDDMSHHHPFHW